MPEFFVPKNEKEITDNVHVVNFSLELSPAINELISYLDSVGGKTYVVGGCVRDSVLSAKSGIELSPKDIDLEVAGIDLDLLEKILFIKYGNVDNNAKDRAVLKVKLPSIEEGIDVSVPRVDTYLPEQSKDRGINITPDPYLDRIKAISRRDLTINSIIYDPVSKQLIDPFGGYQDLMDGIIRVTDKEAFTEDPLRVLRVAKFASKFGFRISDETIKLSRAVVESGRMVEINPKDLKENINTLLVKGYTPSIGLRFFKEIGYLDLLFPEVSNLSNVPQEPDYHPEGDVFTHTMQVVDAMAEIIRREHKIQPMSFELKRALMLGALLHDIGKLTNTKIDEETKRISSLGHEEAGKDPAKEIIRRLFKTDGQNSEIEFEKLILFLISDHMKPIQLHEESKNGTNMDKALRRLIDKCFKNDTTPEQLSLIVEADKLGRNPDDKTKPLSIDDKPELKAALEWYRGSVSRIVSSLELLSPTKVKSPLSVEQFLNQDFCRSLTKGFWIQTINKCVYLDYIDGLISSTEPEILEKQALERANIYFSLIFKDSDPKSLINNREFWNKFKIEDPREAL